MGICELPPGALARIKAGVDAAGRFSDYEVVELVDSATMDEAAAAGMDYRPPGA